MDRSPFVVANQRINPGVSTSMIHAGLPSTRHLEPRDGLCGGRLRVCRESAGAGEIQSGFTTPPSGRICTSEYRRGLWYGNRPGVQSLPRLCLSLIEGSRYRFGTLWAALSAAAPRSHEVFDR